MTCKNHQIKIGLVNFPGAQQSALLGLGDLFQAATNLAEPYSAPSLETVHIELLGNPSNSLPECGTLDAIICPPRLQEGAPLVSISELAWLKSHHDAGCLICSICAGAFILASAGLLNDRPATTHWQLKDAFHIEFPDVLLDTDKLLIDDGDIVTAGGVMAWIDLGLHLIERYQSPILMLSVARQFLVEPRRREQRYYSSFSPQLGHSDKGILKVQHWLQRSYRKHQTIKDMAEIAGMSERTFLRRFHKLTGLTPIAYLQTLRVEKARALLELSTDSFSQIAWNVGYQDPAALRKIFIRIVGLGPKEYRKRFGVTEFLVS